MNPVHFPQENCVFAKNQPEYLPLPVCKVDDAYGSVISCWRLGFWERISVLLFGRIYVRLATFNKPLTPQMLSVTFDKEPWNANFI